jgi:putative transposase
MEKAMAWTEITREHYRREGGVYASDTTDAEWGLIEPLMPGRKGLGRPRTTKLRSVVDALLYIASTGCQWRQLPREFPPPSTVQNYFYPWSQDGTLARLNEALVAMARERLGRKAHPSAGVIDSQSVKTTESGGERGYDAAKKIKGRKRHIVTDTLGHLISWQVHSADIQDRDGAIGVLAKMARRYPRLRHVFADSAYAGDRIPKALASFGRWNIEIIRRPDAAKGFHVLPRRWVVERTFAMLGRCRRLAKDFEASITSATAWLLIASIRTLTRRLARP